MGITTKAEYACLAIIELARSWGMGAPQRVRRLAEVQDIPEPYLIQILLQLKAAGLVRSFRGSVGGYRLARSPWEISVAEVVAAIDGRSDRTHKSRSETGRSLFDLLDRASAAEWHVLADTTIGHLAGIEVANDRVV
jgi:Rrf2 family transcriptional regulator, cysteine metabolism repressor